MNIPTHFWVASSGWVNRIVMGFIQIFSIPLILKQLGIESYAVFSILSGLVMWFALSDLGLSSVLQNSISEHRISNRPVQAIITKYLCLIFILTVIECLIFACIANKLQFWLIKNVSSQSHVFLLYGVLYILFTNSSIGYKILFAMHKGYLSYFLQTISNILSFISLLLLYYCHLSINIYIVVAITLVPQILCALIALHLSVSEFSLKDVLLKSFFEDSLAILKKSSRFFLFMLNANFVLGVDYLFMAKFLNADQIVSYNILNRLYMFIAFGYSALLTALWPIMSEAFASRNRDKYKKANKTLSLHILYCCIYIIVATLFLILTQPIILHLLNTKEINLNLGLIGLFCLYYCIRVFVDFYCMALQSRNSVKILIITSPLQAIITIGLMYFWVQKFGLYGVMYSLILGFLLTAVWIVPLTYFRGLRKYE